MYSVTIRTIINLFRFFEIDAGFILYVVPLRIQIVGRFDYLSIISLLFSPCDVCFSVWTSLVFINEQTPRIWANRGTIDLLRVIDNCKLGDYIIQFTVFDSFRRSSSDFF